MKCPKCDYEWETHSKLGMVTCPSCLLKVKNTNIVQHFVMRS